MALMMQRNLNPNVERTESLPDFEEMMLKFIKRPRCDVNVNWPYGAVVLCRLWYCFGGRWIKNHLVFRSKGPECHAEARLLECLDTVRSIEFHTSSIIRIEMFQNLSPCNDNQTSCAKHIAAYKKCMESRGKVVHITITFANFYRIDDNSNNSSFRASKNIEGLQMLRDNGVDLRLLTGETEWRQLLWDKNLLHLSEQEKVTCLNQALLGVNREMRDKLRFQVILGFAANRLGYRELRDGFIDGFDQEVLLACKITYFADGRITDPECAVFRSGVECAVSKLFKYLTLHYSEVTRLNLEIIQNTFSCHCAERFCGFSCVGGMLRFKKNQEQRGKTVSISLSYIYGPIIRSEGEQSAVRALLKAPSITVCSFSGKQAWQRFLTNTQLVDLNRNELIDCLKRISLS